MCSYKTKRTADENTSAVRAILSLTCGMEYSHHLPLIIVSDILNLSIAVTPCKILAGIINVCPALTW